MHGLNPFNSEDRGDFFDSYNEFVPEHLPEPGRFLTDHNVLGGDDHVEFHKIVRDVFEQRGVYDITFGYNLTKLNLDQRHPDAGFRYARERDAPEIVRAAFTPTTPFCPQAHTLATGSFRAWYGLRENYDYELVRVRVSNMHHNSEAINEELHGLDDEFERTGKITVTGDQTDEQAEN